VNARKIASATLHRLATRFEPVRWLQEGRRVRWRLATLEKEYPESEFYPLYLDYPINPVPRYGYGTPSHELLFRRLAENAPAYEATTSSFGAYRDQLRAIPAESAGPAEPYWNNHWLLGMDMVSLYCLPAQLKPKLYIEVGSGNSTKFVRKSVTENGLGTTMVSIDPHPRAEIDAICDRVIREPLENLDLAVFDDLEARDILMLDSSHRCFQNSDVTAFFLDVLPRLKPGVVIHVHDVYLPDDYPPDWAFRYYSEQYLLAVLLLADDSRYEVILP
jgi:hypothetical protein